MCLMVYNSVGITNNECDDAYKKSGDKKVRY